MMALFPDRQDDAVPAAAPRGGILGTLQGADGPALLHKRGGLWRLFQWSDVEREVQRLITLLGAFGLGQGARLAVSGAYEPDLLFLALATEAIGGRVYPLSRQLQGEALAEAVAAVKPTHAFVQSRRSLSRWLAMEGLSGGVVPLFSAQAAARVLGGWRVVPLHPLQALTSPLWQRKAGSLDAHVGWRSITWVDEGTEWSGGWVALRDLWLADRRLLAFPEAGESAARDRREIQPTQLLCSPARRRELAEELARRQPSEGSWGQRFGAWAAAAPEGLIGQLLQGRLNRLQGFQRLETLGQKPVVAANAAPSFLAAGEPE